ncbi:carbohydrate ABC transporter permease [Actinomyces ruminicola]|uniref:Raffinose/stachyose/melibiose transport system permease protein n=1 Tax=Actinomyces ruminicola TaxID=332524 RepID=A0A1H0A6P6_9ACTO|nr:sugar ABC transporter permease [Actinomyces ruminicola]SDN29309.1 raffinose/stachyose/melibiose transport system permease protein [Actinomyces ruminicola]
MTAPPTTPGTAATTRPPRTADTRPRRLLSKRQGRAVISVALLALPLLVYGLFMLYPLGRVLTLSFYRWDGLGAGEWVGVDNYVKTFSDDRLLGAFLHALILIIFYAVIPLAVGLVLATLLTRTQVRGLGFFRTVVFLPQVIAMVVLAIAWRRIYAPDGLLNSLLRGIGLDALTRTWLGDFSTALIAVGLIGTWVSTGLVTVLLMSGISNIPKDYYEAATLDGAGWWRRFWHITIPGVRAEILVSLTLTVIAALKTFDLVYVTTSGGPGTSTTVPSYEVYNQAFRLGSVGTASSLAVILTLVIFAINLTINLLGERD